MTFDNVKTITIGGVAVKKLTLGEKILWEAASGLLPDEYQRVEYIESTGAQYFDTDVNPSNYSDGISYVFRGCFTDFVATGGNNYLFGCLNDGCRSGNISVLKGTTATSMIVYIGALGNGTYSTSETPLINTDFEITMTATSLSIDNFTASHNGTAFKRTNASFTACDMPNANIYLLQCSGVGANSKPFCGKLYSFSMNTADGVPIRNFVPCYRASDSVIGLYDTVEDKFYENIGTGSFTKGADV